MTSLKKPLLLFRGSGFFLGLAAGLLILAAYPPWNLWPLQLFALVPLFFVLLISDKRQDFLLAFFGCGLTLIAAGYSWMTRFSEWSGAVSYAFWLFLVFYQSFFFLLIGAAFLAVKRFAGKYPALASVPLLWTLGEHWATYGPFGIPEWIGHGQLHNPLLHPVARTVGVNGISFFVTLWGLATAALLTRGPKNRLFAVTATSLAFLLIGCALASRMSAASQDPKGVSVVLLQPAIAPDILNDGSRGQEVLDAYIDLTRAFLSKNTQPDLIFWSEMVFPFSFNEKGPTRARMAAALTDYSGKIILGGPEKTGGRYYNAAFLISGDDILGIYRKVRLFPFGEYTPLRAVLGFIRDDLPAKLRAQDYSSGNDPRPLDAGNARVGISICFESVYTDFVRRQVADGAQILANLTNDGWFAGSAVDEHHLFVGSMRAVENGRYYLQIASSGITAAVDPEGRTVSRAGDGKSSALRWSVPLREGFTPYTRLGYARFLILALVTALMMIAARTRRTAP